MATQTQTAIASSDDVVMQRSAGEPHFVTRRIGGETIVVPVSGHVGDLDAIYTFNEVGSRVWALLNEPIAIRTLVGVLADEYDAPAEQIAADVLELLSALESKGLVCTIDDRPTAA